MRVSMRCRGTGLESINGRIIEVTLDNIRIIRFMAWVSVVGPMAVSTTVNGVTIGCMELVCIHGQTGGSIWENLRKVKSTVMGSLDMRMAHSFKVTGSKVKVMDWELSIKMIKM